MPDIVTIRKSGINYLDALLGSTQWRVPAVGLELTFSHPYEVGGNLVAVEDYLLGLVPGSILPFDASESQAIESALSAWSSVADIKFTWVDEAEGGTGDVRLSKLSAQDYQVLNPGTSEGFASYPRADLLGGDVWINASADPKNFFYLVFHEVGHALGLKHPFEGADKLDVSFELLDEQLTAMAYSDGQQMLWYDEQLAQFEYVLPVTPGIYDISAIQYLYGPNNSANAGDTVYRFTPDVPFKQAIWDVSGEDTIDISLFSTDCIIDLNAGQLSSVTFTPQLPVHLKAEYAELLYTGSNNLGIAFGVAVENLVTGSGNDLIIGNEFDNKIFLNGGLKIVDGGDGLDTVFYDSNQAVIQISDEHLLVLQDSLQSVERVVFNDVSLAFDLEGASSAGGIYRLYKAALNRAPDLEGLGYWIAQADLGYKDAVRMAEDFTWSDEFQTLYGLKMLDNFATGSDISALVSGFYRNVLSRQPDQGGLEFYTSVIELRERTLGQVLAEISDSPENYANTIESLSQGISYDLWLA